ncbi:MAG: J domain-containing protein [Alphaproteobacteria bacterium]|nr:J domain-containing protein [Alphaproteobacteria bacterium]MBV9061613.1 J domain-containing protein [Alphaproteobacteria bacterium]
MRLGDSVYSSSRVVQRNPVQVEITLQDGAPFRAKLFVPVQGRISDLLNDDRSFLPVERDGEHLALAKSSIKQVRMPPSQAAAKAKCPYSVLGVREGASAEEIKRAYRELSTANHPDRVRGAGLGTDFVEFATQNMIRINSAYAQLTKGVQQAA